MALNLDTIRATAERGAASHQLEVVDLTIQNSGKFRTLQVFIEKNADERAKMAAKVKAAKEAEAAGLEFEADATIPSGVAVETLSGVTHEDCAAFAQDFGTVLDVEDLIPGAEYTLEVSSPGLDRPLKPPKRPWDVARVSFEIARRHRFVRELAALPDDVECHVLPARGTSARDDTLLGSRDFSGVQQRIDDTYDASRAYLDAHL